MTLYDFLFEMELNLSQAFMTPPNYWRTVPFREFCILMRRINKKHDSDQKKPKTITDRKGKKRRVVPVLDSK